MKGTEKLKKLVHAPVQFCIDALRSKPIISDSLSTSSRITFRVEPGISKLKSLTATKQRTGADKEIMPLFLGKIHAKGVDFLAVITRTRALRFGETARAIALFDLGDSTSLVKHYSNLVLAKPLYYVAMMLEMNKPKNPAKFSMP